MDFRITEKRREVRASEKAIRIENLKLIIIGGNETEYITL